MRFLLRWVITALAVAAAVWLVPGIDIIGGDSAWIGIALFGLILSLINISIKPILQILSLPVTILTLGIFYLIVILNCSVINVLCIGMVNRCCAVCNCAVN